MEEDPKKLLAMVRGLRAMLDPDPEDILAALAEMRTMIPPEFRRAGKDLPETTSRLDGSTEEDLAWDAAQEAVESMLAEVQAVAQAKRQRLFEKILDIYYGAEEASRDPKNAHLIPHLEAMRKAYEKDHGHPIPTKEETEARRRWRGASGIESVDQSLGRNKS